MIARAMALPHAVPAARDRGASPARKAMNTPAHVIFAFAAFARPGDKWRNVAAVAGGLAPDLSLYLLVGVSLYVLGFGAEQVFRDFYYSNAWQAIFAVDNSFVVWGAALAICFWRGWGNGVILTLSALLHLMFDFALHHDDARRHFWPVSDWIFVSPVSYWDHAHYGDIIGPIEIAVSLLLCVVLAVRFGGRGARAGIAVLALAQLSPLIIWAAMF